jgi:hypothetical protein
MRISPKSTDHVDATRSEEKEAAGLRCAGRRQVSGKYEFIMETVDEDNVPIGVDETAIEGSATQDPV